MLTLTDAKIRALRRCFPIVENYFHLAHATPFRCLKHMRPTAQAGSI
ncbi:MAG: hypothetical protein IJ761_01830 [Bacteroidales bacterium]|nr:hypothetical protein [Bacteroidales bacterium]